MRIILTLTEASGAGKTSVAEVLSEYSDDQVTFRQVVTSTTRAPRPGEVDGVHYHFLTEEQFATESFIEQVVLPSGRYGISVAAAERVLVDPSATPVIVCDVAGLQACATWCRSAGHTHIPVLLSFKPPICGRRILTRSLDRMAALALTRDATEAQVKSVLGETANRLDRLVTETEDIEAEVRRQKARPDRWLAVIVTHPARSIKSIGREISNHVRFTYARNRRIHPATAA